MRENFAHRFIDLSRASLAAEPIAKLGFDHVERRLDV